MVYARVVFLNKGGWKCGKHVWYCAEDVDTIVNHARKNARGRKFVVQPDLQEAPKPWHPPYPVFDLDAGVEVWKVLDGIFPKRNADGTPDFSANEKMWIYG